MYRFSELPPGTIFIWQNVLWSKVRNPETAEEIACCDGYAVQLGCVDVYAFTKAPVYRFNHDGLLAEQQFKSDCPVDIMLQGSGNMM